MSIKFSDELWDQIKTNYSLWWKGDLDRPLINIELTGVKPNIPEPQGPIHHRACDYKFSIPPEVIVNHWEYILSARKYVGDGYPNVLPDFGPGVNAAFMGAKPRITEQTVWFEAEEYLPVEQRHFVYNTEESWFNRISDIYRAAADYFQGRVCLGMTHLNNGIDPVARFFDSETMILAFYDSPEQIKRLIWENHELFMIYYNAFLDAIGPKAQGYTCWGYVFSQEPHFMFQSDFSAMIGPDMFEEFILPELEACCRKIPNSFYHLDGPGQLPHLDLILRIPELKGVQWVPGTGQPDEKHWPEVYRKIKDAGKLIQIFGELDTLDVIAEQIGTAKGIYYYGRFDISHEDKVIELIDKYSKL